MGRLATKALPHPQRSTTTKGTIPCDTCAKRGSNAKEGSLGPGRSDSFEFLWGCALGAEGGGVEGRRSRGEAEYDGGQRASVRTDELVEGGERKGHAAARLRRRHLNKRRGVGDSNFGGMGRQRSRRSTASRFTPPSGSRAPGAAGQPSCRGSTPTWTWGSSAAPG